jgi:hypothetical protein
MEELLTDRFSVKKNIYIQNLLFYGYVRLCSAQSSNLHFLHRNPLRLKPPALVPRPDVDFALILCLNAETRSPRTDKVRIPFYHSVFGTASFYGNYFHLFSVSLNSGGAELDLSS